MKQWLRQDNEDPMNTLIRMAVELKYEDIPEEVVEFSKVLIADTVGCMVGGHGTTPIPDIVDLIKETGGKEEAYIPFFGGKVPAEQAAMCMGPMTRAIDFAPIHADAMHQTEHVLPAMFGAMGLLDSVDGKDFITAFVAGVEVLIRIGIAYNGNVGIARGRSNGHYIFGSVIGAGKLLGLDEKKLANAIGIARNMTQPHDMATYHPVTHMVKVHQGFIAQDAVNCCKFANIGVTGPVNDVLLSDRGFLNMADWETKPQALLEDLGKKWGLMDIEMKAYAGCKCLHMSVYASKYLVDKHGLKLEDIENIHVDESQLNMAVAGGDLEKMMNPADTYQCQFSVPFMVSTMLHDNDVMPLSFQGDKIWRSEIRDFMDKVTLTEDKSIEDWSSKVTITTKDGKKYSKLASPVELKGSVENRYTQEEVVEKFKKVLPHSLFEMDEQAVDSLTNTIFDLENSKDIVKDVILPITPQ